MCILLLWVICIQVDHTDDDRRSVDQFRRIVDNKVGSVEENARTVYLKHYSYSIGKGICL